MLSSKCIGSELWLGVTSLVVGEEETVWDWRRTGRGREREGEWEGVASSGGGEEETVWDWRTTGGRGRGGKREGEGSVWPHREGGRKRFCGRGGGLEIGRERGEG